MKRLARGLLAGPWVGALLALLTWGVVAPASARAGCSSDRVRHGPQPGGADAGLELLSLAGTAPAGHGEGPRERPTPCSGALCSGNPATPFSVPSPAPPPWTGHWALPAFLAPVTGPASYACPPVPPRLSPVDLACPIFRPPRALPAS